MTEEIQSTWGKKAFHVWITFLQLNEREELKSKSYQLISYSVDSYKFNPEYNSYGTLALSRVYPYKNINGGRWTVKAKHSRQNKFQAPQAFNFYCKAIEND